LLMKNCLAQNETCRAVTSSMYPEPSGSWEVTGCNGADHVLLLRRGQEFDRIPRPGLRLADCAGG